MPCTVPIYVDTQRRMNVNRDWKHFLFQWKKRIFSTKVYFGKFSEMFISWMSRIYLGIMASWYSNYKEHNTCKYVYIIVLDVFSVVCLWIKIYSRLLPIIIYYIIFYINLEKIVVSDKIVHYFYPRSYLKTFCPKISIHWKKYIFT